MEKQLSNQESLAIISEMISRAKREAAGDGSFQFLLWGSIVAFCNLAQYALDRLGYEQPYIVWLATIPAVVWSFVHEVQKKRKSRVKSHLNRIIGQLWLGVFVGIAIILAFMSTLSYNHNPVILVLAALGVFCTGSMIKDPIVRLGGLVLAAGAVIGFMVPMSEQCLVAGIAFIFGYLGPGFYLKSKYRARV